MSRLNRLFQQAGAERLSSLVGQTVAGRYLITGELGRGGMGVVYRAEDQKANHLPRALKVLLPFAPAETRSRFQDESRVLAQVVGIDGLCRVHEVGIVDCPPFQQEPFLVMDLIAGVELEVDGRSRHYLELRELLADRAAGRLPPAEVVRLLRRCAKALEAVHALRPAGRESPIVHRDLKPENILLSPSSDATMRFHVHIVDFGLAAESPLHVEAGEGGARIEGTPLYMAPEQLSGTGPVGPAADVWALGILLFQLTTGQLPFTCDVTSPGSAVERMRAAVRRTPAWELIEDVDLRQIGERCLAHTPQDRPSMSELVRSFDLWLQQLPQPATPFSRRLELWARRNRGAAVVCERDHGGWDYCC
ncbi:MAG: serine/threonine-protein kinase [Pirellulales bacterium]